MSGVTREPGAASVLDGVDVSLGARAGRAGTALVVGGLVVSGAALGLSWAVGDGPETFFRSWLVGWASFLAIALGALFFVILQHLTGATWSVVVRRLAENLAANVLPLVLLFAPLLLGARLVWSWLDPAVLEANHAIAAKSGFLNWPFFLVRCAVYFGCWVLLSRWYLARSARQDASGDPAHAERLQRLSGPAMIAFALTLTGAAFDLLMSLDPMWFSTIFGVYFFAGAVVSALAALIVVTRALQATGRLESLITVEHYHDLGKLLFGFVFFWGYIAFSQYLLIWYGDIPEETVWYLERQEHGWQWISLALLFGHFLVPFVGLLSRRAKRNRSVLTFWAAWILAVHWIDIYWLVMPTWGEASWSALAVDALVFVGIGAVFAGAWLRRGAKLPLVPVREPRLAASAAFKNF